MSAKTAPSLPAFMPASVSYDPTKEEVKESFTRTSSAREFFNAEQIEALKMLADRPAGTGQQIITNHVMTGTETVEDIAKIGKDFATHANKSGHVPHTINLPVLNVETGRNDYRVDAETNRLIVILSHKGYKVERARVAK